MVQVHLFIGGYVHSVGFRRFVQKEAEKLGLSGWVRNLKDRRVEVVAQSSAHSTGSGQASSDQEAKEALEKLIEHCKKGPFMAEVKGVSVTWEERKEAYSSFEILKTE